METTINIDNLKCGGCAASIQEALVKMKGIDTIDVQVENSQVVIMHQTAIDLDAIKAKLRQLGYPETGTTHGIEKLGASAKSYVSCMLGRMHQNDEAA
jgi:copper chaperone